MRHRPSLFLLFMLLGLLASTANDTQAQQQTEIDSTDYPITDCSVPVVIFGEVVVPLRFELHQRTRLSELIALAGGQTTNAKGTVQILHTEPPTICQSLAPSEPQDASKIIENFGSLETYNIADLLRGDDKANPYIRPGDIVNVNRFDRVKVIGSVAHPQRIDLREPLTVSLAIARAGGLSPDAREGKILIHRRNKGRLEIITADLNAITKRQMQDMPLQPGDIVEALGPNGTTNPLLSYWCIFY